jgi:hypothetical protein
MRCRDFVVTEGADQEEIAEVGPAQQVFHEIQRRRIKPLQVIEEERQWMFRSRENADELPKHQLEAPLRVLWRKLGDRRRLSN